MTLRLLLRSGPARFPRGNTPPYLRQGPLSAGLPFFGLSNISAEYMIIGAAAAMVVGAFFVLIVAPALGSYGRVWEKFVAGLVSLFVLAALISVGGLIGLAVVYNWDEITSLF